MLSAANQLLHDLRDQLSTCPVDEIPPLEQVRPMQSDDLTNRAMELYARRRRREVHFGLNADLFGEPVWDLLLDLYVNRRRGQGVTVTAACTAACVPATTAIRWISVLVTRGLVQRKPHQSDGRCWLLELTDEAISTVERILLDPLVGWRG